MGFRVVAGNHQPRTHKTIETTGIPPSRHARHLTLLGRCSNSEDETEPEGGVIRLVATCRSRLQAAYTDFRSPGDLPTCWCSIHGGIPTPTTREFRRARPDRSWLRQPRPLPYGCAFFVASRQHRLVERDAAKTARVVRATSDDTVLPGAVQSSSRRAPWSWDRIRTHSEVPITDSLKIAGCSGKYVGSCRRRGRLGSCQPTPAGPDPNLGCPPP